MKGRLLQAQRERDDLAEETMVETRRDKKRRKARDDTRRPEQRQRRGEKKKRREEKRSSEDCQRTRDVEIERECQRTPFRHCSPVADAHQRKVLPIGHRDRGHHGNHIEQPRLTGELGERTEQAIDPKPRLFLSLNHAKNKCVTSE
jgi:hypothetical protein